MNKLYVSILIGITLLGVPVAYGGVADTRHNLSASGPGQRKSIGVGIASVCLYCHTPHRAGSTRALWNRDLPAVTYNLYASSTLEATPRQPTGASRLCLSCHDGTTAMGNLRVPREPGSTGTGPGPMTGRGSLGLDLSNDHPISFVYSTELSQRQGQLVDPASLSGAVRLDQTQQLQCTSCHDPHEDRYRKFLRVDDRKGALCTSCHQQQGWRWSPHATSSAFWNGVGTNPWPDSPYRSVADNSCGNCHQSHGAEQPVRLLNNAQERKACLVCHNGGVASKNIERELRKASTHQAVSSDWTHDPREEPSSMSRHVTCVDCHNPHQSSPTPGVPPSIPGVLKGVRGVNISGGSIQEASREYEVCLKCHGDWDYSPRPGITRQDNSRNIRLKIDPNNASFHPIAAVGRNPRVDGLEPGYSAGSTIYCTDCHNNDEWTPSGTKPRGPHGSRFSPILEREYETTPGTHETYQAYAMCYKCHSQGRLFNSTPSGTFSHRKHVRERSASCAVCHDAHGSRNNASLINFMLRDSAGRSVVSGTQGRVPEYSAGKCFLSCHDPDTGKSSNHAPL